VRTERVILHELRNMLAVMVGYAEVLAMQPGADPGVAQDLADLRTAGRRALELIEELRQRRDPDEP